MDLFASISHYEEDLNHSANGSDVLSESMTNPQSKEEFLEAIKKMVLQFGKLDELLFQLNLQSKNSKISENLKMKYRIDDENKELIKAHDFFADLLQ